MSTLNFWCVIWASVEVGLLPVYPYFAIMCIFGAQGKERRLKLAFIWVFFYFTPVKLLFLIGYGIGVLTKHITRRVKEKISLVKEV